MMFCACECLCMAYTLDLGEVTFEICISGQNRMCQPYIEMLPHSPIIMLKNRMNCSFLMGYGKALSWTHKCECRLEIISACYIYSSLPPEPLSYLKLNSSIDTMRPVESALSKGIS